MSRTHASIPRGERKLTRSPINEGRFGKMFRRLDPLAPLDPGVLANLAESMREAAEVQPPGGWSSGGATPAGGDNVAIPSAYTYLGQFVDHDITFDTQSQVDRLNDPDALVSFRSPRFDLDSVYGSGPADEPFQYAADGMHLLLEPNVRGEMDLPRTSVGIALIGDPRNDENVIVSQLQVVFIRLHNKFLDMVLGEGQLTGDAAFSEAQRRTRWHYQWVVARDFVRLIVGDDTYSKLWQVDADGLPDIRRRFYKPKTAPYIPVEFSGAAYRFGHSQVRELYDLSAQVPGRPIFVPGDQVGELDDLRGRRPLPAGWTIDWKLFLEIDGSSPQPSRLIDGKLSPGLFDLPGPAGGLAAANLRRGEALGLPSGQDVARFLGAQPVPMAPFGAPEPTPLWFYLLAEAASGPGGGVHLGPVGGRIVGEVLLGLLDADKQSWINVEPGWEPQPPVATAPGELDLAALVKFATT
jgi:hypothetical protein